MVQKANLHLATNGFISLNEKVSVHFNVCSNRLGQMWVQVSLASSDVALDNQSVTCTCGHFICMPYLVIGFYQHNLCILQSQRVCQSHPNMRMNGVAFVVSWTLV